MPQTNYNFPDSQGLPGTVASLRICERVSKAYRKNKHTQTLTFGGSATDGTYSAKIDGVLVSVVRTGGSPSTNANLATQYEANLEADTNLDNVIDPTVNSAVVTIEAVQPEDRINITDVTAPSPGTLTLAETVPYSKAVLPVGVAVKRGTAAGEIAPCTTGTVRSQIVGIVERQQSAMKGNTGLEADVDGYEAGSMVNVITDGEINVDCENAAAEGANVWVRVLATGSEVAGAIRSGADGTAHVWTGTPTATSSVSFGVEILFRGKTYILGYTSDASATATEIADGMRADLLIHDDLDNLVIGTGTTTLILTGPPGEPLLVQDMGMAGLITWAETTPVVVDAVEMPNWQFVKTTNGAGRQVIRMNATP